MKTLRLFKPLSSVLKALGIKLFMITWRCMRFHSSVVPLSENHAHPERLLLAFKSRTQAAARGLVSGVELCSYFPISRFNFLYFFIFFRGGRCGNSSSSFDFRFCCCFSQALAVVLAAVVVIFHEGKLFYRSIDFAIYLRALCEEEGGRRQGPRIDVHTHTCPGP